MQTYFRDQLLQFFEAIFLHAEVNAYNKMQNY